MNPTETRPVINLKAASKRFGDTIAVNKVSFSIHRGEVVGFVGPNGAGKTTAISLMLGFLRTTDGVVRLFDRAVIPKTAHCSHTLVGYAAGDMALFSQLTGTQYLSFLLKRVGTTADRQAELIKRLHPVLDKRLKHLSRGNKQKIALIGALQHSPELLILDEPTSGLDPLMQETFLELIAEERELGTTVFMSSHILSEVGTVCSRVLFMKKGSLLVDTPVEKLLQQQGRHISITAQPEKLQHAIKRLPEGSKGEVLKGTVLTFVYAGPPTILLRWLVSLGDLKDISIAHQTLDDIFYRLYADVKTEKEHLI